MRKRALDLFCCAGGVAMGLHRAGFDVIGVDIKPQPNYPFQFVQADALRPPFDLGDFDFIWASPPCQAYSISRNNGCHQDAPELVEPTRALLAASGKPYVIENVGGAPLHFAFMLCGASFGLGASGFDLNRHRYFESNIGILAPPCQHRAGKTMGVYGHGTNSWHRKKFGRNIAVAEMREAMGIDWMTRAELSQAIPPAYSEYIGREVMRSRGDVEP
jgi:DNA (cytosine-5)-methyltransferase 1